MSVWPKTLPAGASLSGSEGDLVSVSIHVDPRCLESMLETLAQLSFPINPQIYHDALIVYQFADQREETEVATLVEFPAYAERLADVRRALHANGFDPSAIQVTGMLDDMYSATRPEPAPPGKSYLSRYRIKCRPSALVQ